jgi:hypothetical protein
VLVKVKAAVLAKYSKVAVTDIDATDDGWIVSVTTERGQKGTVTVDEDFTVGHRVLAQSVTWVPGPR